MKFTLSVRNTQATIANFRAFDRHLQTEVRGVVRETGAFCKDLVKFFCPVRTGFMRSQVRVAYGDAGYSWEVGWREDDFTRRGLAFYPLFQEFGTRFMAAQPSLFPAYAEVKPQFIRDITAAVRRSAQRGQR